MRALVFKFQAEFSRPRRDDGRTQHRLGEHDDSAVGTALHSGIHKAMEAIRARCRRVLADG